MTDLFFRTQNTKTIDRSEVFRNYSEGISTLRLHENYIKIIEDSESSMDQEISAETQTTHELLQADKIPKKS